MKVLLINGSPHREGCTYTALCEVSRALNDNGVDTDIFWIGNKALSGCIACKKCQGTGKCVFQDSVNEFLEIAGDYDGFVFGTPVHWAGATGAMTSFMDRVFYADLNGGGSPLPPETGGAASSGHLSFLWGSEWRPQPLPAETGSGRDLGQKSGNHSNLGPDE